MSFQKRKSSSAGGETKKRKRVVLSVDEQLKICEQACSGMSYSTIWERYGIGRSTIVDIRKNEAAMREFQRKSVEMNLPVKKSMKPGQYEDLDEALYLWNVIIF